MKHLAHSRCLNRYYDYGVASFHQVVELQEASIWPEPSGIPAPQFLGDSPPAMSALERRELVFPGALAHKVLSCLGGQRGTEGGGR